MASIAEEVPIALAFNGIAHAVMLATPENLEDFALGFALSEGIVARAGDVHDIEIATAANGITVEVAIAAVAFASLKLHRRNLAGRTGCGLCGTESLDHVFRGAPTVDGGLVVDPVVFASALDSLSHLQPLHAATGAMHAAAWVDEDGGVRLVREDVGRHNALDKTIGALAQSKLAASRGFVLMTSRASSEIVHKAARVGIPLVAAISAPTSLAIDLAQRTGVTLVGFVRGARYTVYAHGQRLQAMTQAVAS
jgi:FdhD protein